MEGKVGEERPAIMGTSLPPWSSSRSSRTSQARRLAGLCTIRKERKYLEHVSSSIEVTSCVCIALPISSDLVGTST